MLKMNVEKIFWVWYQESMSPLRVNKAATILSHVFHGC